MVAPIALTLFRKINNSNNNNNNNNNNKNKAITIGLNITNSSQFCFLRTYLNGTHRLLGVGIFL